MSKTSLKNSAYLALLIGILLPAAETVRRFKQLTDPSYFLHWFDDYLLGGLLLLAVWFYRTNQSYKREWLIGIWGIYTGALLLSTLGQIQTVINGQDDHGVFSVTFVLVAKLLLLVIGVFGMERAFKGDL